MTIQIIADGVEVPVENIKFSDGGTNLRVIWPEGFVPKKCINFIVLQDTPANSVLFELYLATDSVHAQLGIPKVEWNLVLPYLPHARADRRFDKHAAFPLREFLRHLPPFQKVYLTDPHSDWFADEGRHEVLIKEQHECFLELRVPFDPKCDLLMAPDAGAEPKVRKLHDVLGGLFECVTKTRDPDTGRVTSTTVPDLASYEGRRCIIVDDICDGGGTFLPLAEALRAKGASCVELYVTHGIFAKGLDPFKGVIDKLHVYQIVGNYISREDILKFNSTTWSAN